MKQGPEILAAREFERLALSERCLARAQEATCHLQEQVRLLSRAAWNLDEFFTALLAERTRCQPDPGRAIALDKATRTVRQRARALLHQQYRIWRDEVSRRLEERGIALAGVEGISPNQQREARSYFDALIFPALTPLAIDQRHPLPRFRSRSLNLAVLLAHQGQQKPQLEDRSLAVVPMPNFLHRFATFKSERGRWLVFVEKLTAMHARELFPGFDVELTSAFRVILGAASNGHPQASTPARDRSPPLRSPVHLELEMTASPLLERMLAGTLTLGSADVYRVPGPLQLSDLAALDFELRSETADARDEELERLSG